MTVQEREAVAVLAHLYLQNGKHQEAVHLLQALHALFPSDRCVICLLAWALLASGDLYAAIAMADRALRFALEPAQIRSVLLIKSEALWRLGLATDARAILDQYEKIQMTTP